MTTRPTADAGVTDIVAKVREQRDAAVGIGHPDEAGYIAFLSAILDHIDALTAQLAAAKAVLSKLNEGGTDDVRIAVRNAIFSAGGSFLNLCDSGELIDAAMKAARTGAR